MNIFSKVKAFDFVAKLFAAARLNLTAMVEAGDENALKAALDQAAKSAAAPTGPTAAEVAEVSAENAKLGARVTELETQLATATGRADKAEAAAKASAATLSGYQAAFAAAGLKSEKPEDFGKALQDRISTRAGEKLGELGVRTDFVQDDPNGDPAKAKKGGSATRPGIAGLAQLFKADAQK